MILSFLLAVLGTASAQTYSLDKCNPDIETVKDFNSTKYLGDWYEIKRGYNFYEDHTKCYKISFLTNDEAVFNMVGSYEVEDIGRLTIRYTLNATEEDTKMGRFNAEPGLISDSTPYWVLDTDYDDFSVQYSCSNAYNGKIEYAWIHTRSSRPDETIVAKAEAVLTNRNIKMPLIDALQTCQ